VTQRRSRAGKQISVYLEPEDIERLRLLAETDFKSMSTWVVDKIRATYKEVFGDRVPKAP
jgi:uncharacterized protein with ACT and thioredoxin-like domain